MVPNVELCVASSTVIPCSYKQPGPAPVQDSLWTGTLVGRNTAQHKIPTKTKGVVLKIIIMRGLERGLSRWKLVFAFTEVHSLGSQHLYL